MLFLALSASPAMAGQAATRETLIDFVAAQGCAIGPDTHAMAVSAGYGAAELDALVARARGMAGAVRTGDWVILPPALCRIRPPKVRSAIRLTDPEVVGATKRAGGDAPAAERGCFLDGDRLVEGARVRRGWSTERARAEYMRFVSRHLGAGTLAFHGADPLRAPPGLQLLIADCAQVPAIDAIRRSQAVRDRYFDAAIREDAAEVRCADGAGPGHRFAERMRRRGSGNAWVASEVQFIALGAGWYTGTGASRMGTPRPPLCRF